MQEPIEIIPVKDRKGRKLFIDLPHQVLCDHESWIPPLRMMVSDAINTKSNPFYRDASIQLFLARRNGKLVGRIAAIENRQHSRYHNDRAGFFGFFDAINDPDVAGALLEVAGDWLRARGMRSMRGPTNPSMNYECGVLVDGFEYAPMAMTTWNPAYYVELLEGCGMSGVQDAVAYFLEESLIPNLSEENRKRADVAAENLKLTVRPFSRLHFNRDAKACMDIFNQAWVDNWGFVPLQLKEFKRSLSDLMLVMDPSMNLIAEVSGEPAAFMLCMPDYNRVLRDVPSGRLTPRAALKLFKMRSLDSVRVFALGIKPEFRRQGIFELFTLQAIHNGLAHGLHTAEASWILADNEAMNRPWQMIGAQQYKRWRIYERAL
jgi:hypothetical protein